MPPATVPVPDPAPSNPAARAEIPLPQPIPEELPVPPQALAPEPGLFAKLTGHIPRGEVLRYLLVGAWNTLFGYLAYATLVWLFTRLTPVYPYIWAAITANIFNITVSFLGYKWFVFRTRGHYLREYTRALAVYIPSITITTVALPLLVGLLRHTTPFPRAAPYLAGAVITATSVTLSFLGHRNFTFKHPATRH